MTKKPRQSRANAASARLTELLASIGELPEGPDRDHETVEAYIAYYEEIRARSKESVRIWEAFDKEADLSTEVRAAFLLGVRVGQVGAATCIASVTQRMVIAHLLRAARIKKRNEGKEVSHAEMAEVFQLNRELKGDFPKRSPRYAEIARRLDKPERPYKESRVRYILEGPRKSKAGNYGKRKRLAKK